MKRKRLEEATLKSQQFGEMLDSLKTDLEQRRRKAEAQAECERIYAQRHRSLAEKKECAERLREECRRRREKTLMVRQTTAFKNKRKLVEKVRHSIQDRKVKEKEKFESVFSTKRTCYTSERTSLPLSLPDTVRTSFPATSRHHRPTPRLTEGNVVSFTVQLYEQRIEDKRRKLSDKARAFEARQAAKRALLASQLAERQERDRQWEEAVKNAARRKDMTLGYNRELISRREDYRSQKLREMEEERRRMRTEHVESTKVSGIQQYQLSEAVLRMVQRKQWDLSRLGGSVELDGSPALSSAGDSM